MISLKRADTAAEVEVILKDPEIFARIAEDGVIAESYEIPMNQYCYMMVMDDDRVIGVWIIHPFNSSTLDIHCNILKEHRRHGKEAGRLILKWFKDQCPKNYVKLNAEIPMVYPEVYHFTKSFGFKDEGINRLSILKQGELVDQWRLGITRDEVK